MHNPETLATLGAQETGWRQTKQNNKTQHNTEKKNEQHRPHQKLASLSFRIFRRVLSWNNLLNKVSNIF